MQDEKTGNTIIIKDKKRSFPVFKIAIVFGAVMGIYFLVNSSGGSGVKSKYETTTENYNTYYDKMKSALPVVESKDGKIVTVAYSKKMFLFDFNGGIEGNEVELLKRNIDYVLLNAKPTDEVAIRLYSPGGSVSAYGLAASELDRLKQAGIPVTMLVDQVAASGGYMMAVVSDKIVAAPFSFIGSVGVVAQVPIYADFLKKVGVEYKLYTAGDHKRNVVSTIQPTEADEAKMKESLVRIHEQFKRHIKKYRTLVDIDKIANGEVFSGQEALDQKLVDEVSTSSDYLLKQYQKNAQIIYINTEESKSSGFSGLPSVSAVTDLIATKIVSNVKNEVSKTYENILVK